MNSYDTLPKPAPSTASAYHPLTLETSLFSDRTEIRPLRQTDQLVSYLAILILINQWWGYILVINHLGDETAA